MPDTIDYDGANRLAQADTTATVPVDYAYLYDPNSNLTRRTVNATTVTSYGFNRANQLCWRASGAFTSACAPPPNGAVTYDYDEAGNLTSSSQGLAISYNGRDQATSMTPPGGPGIPMTYQGPDQTLRIKNRQRKLATCDGSLGLLNVCHFCS